MNVRRDSMVLFSNRGLVGLRHMPEDDVVVRLLDARMAGIVVHGDMIHVAPRCYQAIDFLLGLEIFHRDHIDRADELAFVVVGEKGPVGQRLGVDVEGTNAW